MRTHLEKLFALLTHKRAILEELVERQERFKEFLIRPRWSEFLDYTQPQELLVQKLRQIQAAQDFLLSELAASLHQRSLPTLNALLRHIEPEWQRVLAEAIEAIRAATTQLRSLTKLSQALNQSHWNFVRRYMAEGHGRTELGCTYTSNGYASHAALIQNRYNSSV